MVSRAQQPGHRYTTVHFPTWDLFLISSQNTDNASLSLNLSSDFKHVCLTYNSLVGTFLHHSFSSWGSSFWRAFISTPDLENSIWRNLNSVYSLIPSSREETYLEVEVIIIVSDNFWKLDPFPDMPSMCCMTLKMHRRKGTSSSRYTPLNKNNNI